MKTVICSKIGDLREPELSKRGLVDTIEVPEPQLVDDESVKIKVAYCAICGSDPNTIKGVFGTAVPIGLGHEVSGIIVDLGEKATKKGLQIGDRVAGNFIRPCGTCYYCRNGQEQFCEYAFGNKYNAPGMSQYIVWHESQVFKLPNGMDLKHGCLLEPVSVVVRMADKTQMKVGARVAISGGGPIGLLGLQIMKLYGATSLTLIEPIAERRTLGRKYGAEHTIDPFTQDVEKTARELTNDLGFDVIIDVSGAPSTAELLPKITAYGGHIIYGAMYPKTYEMPINLFNVFYHKELTITGMYLSPFAFPRALQLMEHMQLDDFVTNVFDIDDAKKAFESHISGKHPKTLIRCNKDID